MKNLNDRIEDMRIRIAEGLGSMNFPAEINEFLALFFLLPVIDKNDETFRAFLEHMITASDAAEASLTSSRSVTPRDIH